MGPKTIEYFGFLKDGCEQIYQVSRTDTSNTIWIEAKGLALQDHVSSRLILYDFSWLISQEGQASVLNSLEQGTLEICDPASAFTMQTTFK